LSDTVEWKINEPSDIRKTFRKLGKSEKNQYRTAIRTLAESEDPKVHGNYKNNLGCFTYNITKSFRITFDIDYENRIINIIKIGDHKQIYGKDKHH